jgi:hypothetical protein
MGLWSKKQRRSGRFGGVSKGRKLGPRRRIVEILRVSDTILSKARVKFECGHEGSTWANRGAPDIGSYGHCLKCLSVGEGKIDEST